jgi:polyphosphate kinase 2 (PPK2 family)
VKGAWAMLENIDLKKKIDKATYKQQMAELSERLYYVQQGTWEKGIPVVILFEGWDAAGKGTTIHKLTDPIDPRGYKIYPIRASRTYEKKRPWLWRFWLKIPAKGEWAIFDRSWYGRVLVERMLKLASKEEWERAYRDMVDFERNLADDGAMIFKFFLHISKKEQKKRFKKIQTDPLNNWRVTDEDWRNHKHYKKWLRVYQEMLERTDTEWGVWTTVEATNKRYTQIKVYETIVEGLEKRLGTRYVREASPEEEAKPPEMAETKPVEIPEPQPAAAGIPAEAQPKTRKKRAKTSSNGQPAVSTPAAGG